MLDADWSAGRPLPTPPDGVPCWPRLLSGSFLGVLIRRLPEGRPVAWERSRCEDCGAVLGAADLVPLVQLARTRGRCRFCKVRLGWFYPGVELAALAVAIIAATFDSGTTPGSTALLGWWLLALGWIDARHWLLPDALTLPLSSSGSAPPLAFDPGGLTDRALGAASGYLALRAVAFLYRKFRGRDGPRRRRRQALGGGRGPGSGRAACRRSS